MTTKISLPLRAEPVNPGRISDDKDWLIRDSTDRIIARVPDKATAAQLVAMTEDAKRLRDALSNHSVYHDGTGYRFCTACHYGQPKHSEKCPVKAALAAGGQ